MVLLVACLHAFAFLKCRHVTVSKRKRGIGVIFVYAGVNLKVQLLV